MISSKIISQYDIPEIISIEPIEIGLIHGTFRIKTTNGDFIAQKLHPVLSSDEIADDFLAITNHLQQTDIPSPKAVLNIQGQVLTKLDGEIWRLQTAIPGNSYHTINSEDMARSAGKLLGKFHQVMSSLDYQFKSQKILHDTPVIFKNFIATTEKFKNNELYHLVSSDIELITQAVPGLFLPEDLPKRVIHGDPKISNILFIQNEAVSLVDLDTCNRHTPLVEIGDAIRSWCGGLEDDPHNTLNKKYFSSAISGYLDAAGELLLDQEIDLIPQAAQLITLELVMRFINDFFEDSYFGWDSERYNSRREHNLARVRGQISLYKSMTN
jgi:Ser/Thr protein kinase RdoA (MazF antagonist)